jgi:hypothetical protein
MVKYKLICMDGWMDGFWPFQNQKFQPTILSDKYFSALLGICLSLLKNLSESFVSEIELRKIDSNSPASLCIRSSTRRPRSGRRTFRPLRPGSATALSGTPSQSSGRSTRPTGCSALPSSGWTPPSCRAPVKSGGSML